MRSQAYDKCAAAHYAKRRGWASGDGSEELSEIRRSDAGLLHGLDCELDQVVRTMGPSGDRAA